MAYSQIIDAEFEVVSRRPQPIASAKLRRLTLSQIYADRAAAAERRNRRERKAAFDKLFAAIAMSASIYLCAELKREFPTG